MKRHHAIPIVASLMLAMLVTAAQRASGEPVVAGSALATQVATADSIFAANPRPAPVSVRGVLRDANGTPIRGASIRMTSETDTVRVYSDTLGRFHAKLTAMRGVFVFVQAFGYRDLYRLFRASGHPIDAALALPPPYPLGWTLVTSL